MLLFEEYYNDLTNELKDNIYNLDENIYNYYYSDFINSKLIVNNLIYIDIKAAFPTICNLIYDPNSEFIKKLNSIENKLEKNIFISTNLSHDELILLNKNCKIILFNYVLNNYENITIFEYQKDGILFKGDKTIPTFSKINNLNIKFHIKPVDLYLRFQKTSIYITSSIITIKGYYKNPPKYIENIILPIIFKDEYDLKLKNLIKNYNEDYLNVCKKLYLYDEIKYYYCFNNKYYLDINGKRKTNIDLLNSYSILRFFLYPILELLRI